MNVSAGPPSKPRTLPQKARSEARLLWRDGPVKYVRVLRAKRRFDRSVQRLHQEQG